jgi:signal transduction histidine kinase
MVTLTTALVRRGDQNWVTFSVRDTGPGISEADRPHLFKRFYRGEAGRASGAPGTGLGLAICMEIVRKLNGDLTVESLLGHGTTFTVWLRPASR